MRILLKNPDFSFFYIFSNNNGTNSPSFADLGKSNIIFFLQLSFLILNQARSWENSIEPSFFAAIDLKLSVNFSIFSLILMKVKIQHHFNAMVSDLPFK